MACNTHMGLRPGAPSKSVYLRHCLAEQVWISGPHARSNHVQQRPLARLAIFSKRGSVLFSLTRMARLAAQVVGHVLWEDRGPCAYCWFESWRMLSWIGTSLHVFLVLILERKYQCTFLCYQTMIFCLSSRRLVYKIESDCQLHIMQSVSESS
jgi:hypothetical protein